jgi:hypothetical protein
MTSVACFCGRCYSFSDGVGACPRCGKIAVPAPSLGRRTGRGGPRSETLVLSDGQRTLFLTGVSSGPADGHAPSPGVGEKN